MAIPISDRLQKEISAWEKNLPALPLRYLVGRNLHITLIPPWYVDDIGKCDGLVKKTSRFGRFNIKFNTVSFGPNIYQPRLIWATGNAPPEIIGLRDALSDIFDQPKETRPFRLHLTIARFNPIDFPTFPIKKLKENVLWEEEVNSVVVMESHLSRQGADYEIIAKAPLR